MLFKAKKRNLYTNVYKYIFEEIIKTNNCIIQRNLFVVCRWYAQWYRPPKTESAFRRQRSQIVWPYIFQNEEHKARVKQNNNIFLIWISKSHFMPNPCLFYCCRVELRARMLAAYSQACSWLMAMSLRYFAVALPFLPAVECGMLTASFAFANSQGS